MASERVASRPTSHPARVIRAKEQAFLVDCILRGLSSALVGPSNIGKSALIKSLFSREIQSRLLSEGKYNTAVIPVDCLMAAESEPAFYSLILDRLNGSLERGDVAASTLAALKEKHTNLMRDGEVLARSLFAGSLRLLIHESDLRLVIALDELDEAFQSLPPWPFQMLRALRDEFEGRLAYIAAVTRRLERLRPDASVYEFREMFLTTTQVIQPLTPQDSELCFEDVLFRLGWAKETAVPPGLKELVLNLSGGHPGLIKRIFSVLSSRNFDPNVSLRIWVERLKEDWPIQQECQRLWDELEVEDREGLLAFSAGGREALDAVQDQSLESKGILIKTTEGELTLFSPVFAGFVSSHLSQARQISIKGVAYDQESGRAWANGREITLELTEQQRKLLRLFYRKVDKVCTYSEIIDAVWETGEGVTPGAIYELVKRVRRLVEPDLNNPQYIVSVRGEGYMLQTEEKA